MLRRLLLLLKITFNGGLSAKKIGLGIIAAVLVPGIVATAKNGISNVIDTTRLERKDLSEHVAELDEKFGEVKHHLPDQKSASLAEASEKEETVTPNHPTGQEKEKPAFEYEEVIVRYIIDGDTIIIVNRNDTEPVQKVRLIGVNTEESVASEEYTEKSGKENNAWGKKASDFTKGQLSFGQTVYLTCDDGPKEDKYGRKLRYVWTSLPNSTTDEQELRDKCYNAKLLISGMAEAMIIDNKGYAKEFYSFEKEAIDSRTGLWADDDFRSYMEIGNGMQASQLRRTEFMTKETTDICQLLTFQMDPISSEAVIPSMIATWNEHSADLNSEMLRFFRVIKSTGREIHLLFPAWKAFRKAKKFLTKENIGKSETFFFAIPRHGYINLIFTKDYLSYLVSINTKSPTDAVMDACCEIWRLDISIDDTGLATTQFGCVHEENCYKR